MRIFPPSGLAMADERLEQRRLARAVRTDERDVLLALDHERAVLDQLLAARREAETLDLDHDPAAARRLQELEPEAPSPLRQVLELPRRLLALLLEAADLRELRLRLLGLRLLVAESLDEALEPLDVGADPLHALRRRLSTRCPLEPPLVPRAREVQAAAALELEHGRRHGFEKPAVVRDEDHRRVDRRQLALQPLETLHVEVVRRLVEQQQVGVTGERAGERGARQLAAGEGRELTVEVGIAEAEAAEHRGSAVAPPPAAGVLEPRLRVAVALQRRSVVPPARHRLLELAELLLDPDESRGSGDRVLAQRQPAVAGWTLVVQRDARALLQRDLATLNRRLADDRPQERRLAGAVLTREREPLPAVDRERDPVEEGISGELLAKIRCDQNGHPRRVDARHDRPADMLGTSRGSDPRTQTVDTIRALAMDAVQKANAGHPGTAMALAPVAYLLYRDVMRHNPADPHWPGRDRFVLSAGHACILQYASLHLAGYDLTLDDLKQFRQWGSRTPGHPEWGHTAGIETTTGPLGQGFANGVGMAIAQRFLADRYNRPHHEIVDSWIYAICSDGDMMEGVSQEAASIAGHLGLGRLVYVYDDNHITIDGTTSLTFTTEDKGKRFEAYGWHVQHVDDSEDLDAILGALAAAKAEEDRPSLIVLRTHIAYPAPNAVDTSKAHGSPLGEAEIRATKEAMGLDPDATFVVSDLVREHMAPVLTRGAELQREWDERVAAWAGAFPALARERELDLRGEPRDGWRDALPVFPAGEDVATRDAGRTVMQALKPFTPTMVGGSADLVESNKTEFAGTGIFSATHVGRNVAFGIREHAMGSIVNGIALDPAMLRPYGSTFLIFSDYMRAAVRLSALMGLRTRLGLDPRLDRRRRGRPDPSAGRAPHGAPGDSEPLVRAAGRRERDLDGVAHRRRASRRARCPGAHAAEAADARSHRRRARRGHPARRVHALATR